MSSMAYRAVIVNLEGCAVKSNGRLLKSTAEALAAVEQKGVRLLYVSGRSVPYARRLLKTLKHTGYFVSHSGSIISNTKDEKLFTNYLSEEQTYETVLFLEGLNCNVRIVHEELTMGNRKNLNSNFIGKAVLGVNDPLFYPTQFTDDLSETIRVSPVSAPKIEAHFLTEQECTLAARRLIEHFHAIEVQRARPLRLDITPKGVTLRSSIETVLSHYNLVPDEVMYVGSQLLDAPMYERVPYRVTMGNADERIRNAANWTTRGNDDDGLGYVMKEIFRKQFPFAFLTTLSQQQ
ncbi:MAG: HAD hydrolase family protein [Bacilli bacterium]